MKNIESFAEFRNKRCDVLGMGVSNLPLIDMLIAAGAIVTVRDKKTREELGDICDKLQTAGVTLILGEHYLENIDGDIIFRSPGIRPDLPSISNAVLHGALLTSEMELFLSLTKANILAVTGSDGKTTSTTLTHLFVKAQLERNKKGVAYVGGNIGKPLLSEYDKMTNDDYAILELSSFQLMSLSDAPERAAITNISPNHLDWHTDMEEYISAKCNIFDDSTTLILNADNNITYEIAKKRAHNMILFSSSKDSFEKIVSNEMSKTSAIFIRDGHIVYSDSVNEDTLLCVKDIKLPGVHNIENYMTAIALTYGLVSKDIYADIAKTFGGVEHRLEFVRELDGVKYYNSSIDSSPSRTAAALSAINAPLVVICGGYDKNIPFEPLADALCGKARCVVLTGKTAEKIKSAILNCEKYSSDLISIIECPDFSEAVLAAKNAAHEGDCILLSPACASFDAFKNFAERGNFFKKLVNQL